MLAQLIQEIVATFRDPRGFTKNVLLARDHSLRVSFNVGGLAVALNMLQVGLIMRVSNGDLVKQFEGVGGSATLEDGSSTTISFTFMDLVLIAGTAAVLQIILLSFGGAIIGRVMGGVGNLQQTAAAVTWHSLCTALLSIVVSAAEVLLGPNIGALIAIAAVIVGFWLLGNLIGAVHGFENTLYVVGGVIASILGAAVAAGLVLSIFRALFGA